jgi:imidazolonepropionase-like amidohydrolase
MSLLISGATILDGVANQPIEGFAIRVEGRRIEAIGRREELGTPAGATVIDARGKYVIPGLMNANVHLLSDIRLENLVRHLDRFEDLIAEAAQVALKNGLTTVFDTWGPRRALMAVRDEIERGTRVGSRIFCAGNIVGFDGPFSPDFFPNVLDVASGALANRINATWVENVGRHLMWLTPAQIAQHVRAYIAKGIDFLKYASNEHSGTSAGAFLAFSPRAQAAIVAEAQRAGLTAQAHTMSVEGLLIAIEAGCNLIQHANNTGPVPIPEETLELLVKRGTGAVVFPATARRLEWLMKNESYKTPAVWQTADLNARNFIRCGARLLLANDGYILAPEGLTDPVLSKRIGAFNEDYPFALADGHFVWLQAMEEKGMAPMALLRAATRNIAVAYGKDKDLGTIEPGKLADLILLDRNPMESAAHYRCIHEVIKDGRVVDRAALPVDPILTRAAREPTAEEAAYVPFLARGGQLPGCGCH